MLMYQKDSEIGVNVSQTQVKTLEEAGWTKAIKPEKVIEEATKVAAKVATKTAEVTAKAEPVKPVVKPVAKPTVAVKK